MLPESIEHFQKSRQLILALINESHRDDQESSSTHLTNLAFARHLYTIYWQEANVNAECGQILEKFHALHSLFHHGIRCGLTRDRLIVNHEYGLSDYLQYCSTVLFQVHPLRWLLNHWPPNLFLLDCRID